VIQEESDAIQIHTLVVPSSAATWLHFSLVRAKSQMGASKHLKIRKKMTELTRTKCSMLVVLVL
jgi:hypothetical protein